MITTPASRPNGRTAMVAIAAVGVLAVILAGAWLFARPNVGIGPSEDSRLFTPADVEGLLATPVEAGLAVTPADLPRGLDWLTATTNSPEEALDLVWGHPSLSQNQRVEILSGLTAGLEAVETSMYDLGTAGAARPVGQPGGMSITLLIATYRDVTSATAAFDTFVAAYDGWEFEGGRDVLAQGDEGAIYPHSVPAAAHGRCFSVGDQTCEQELRVWRADNLVITTMHEGDGPERSQPLYELLAERTR